MSSFTSLHFPVKHLQAFLNICLLNGHILEHIESTCHHILSISSTVFYYHEDLAALSLKPAKRFIMEPFLLMPLSFFFQLYNSLAYAIFLLTQQDIKSFILWTKDCFLFSCLPLLPPCFLKWLPSKNSYVSGINEN